jgi:hypothetical protein
MAGGDVSADNKTAPPYVGLTVLSIDLASVAINVLIPRPCQHFARSASFSSPLVSTNINVANET